MFAQPSKPHETFSLRAGSKVLFGYNSKSKVDCYSRFVLDFWSSIPKEEVTVADCDFEHHIVGEIAAIMIEQPQNKITISHMNLLLFELISMLSEKTVPNRKSVLLLVFIFIRTGAVLAQNSGRTVRTRAVLA